MELDPTDFEAILNEALQGPIRLRFETHGKAVTWRLRANKWRQQAREASTVMHLSEDPLERLQAGKTPWDTLELRVPPGGTEVQVVPRGTDKIRIERMEKA